MNNAHRHTDTQRHRKRHNLRTRRSTEILDDNCTNKLTNGQKAYVEAHRRSTTHPHNEDWSRKAHKESQCAHTQRRSMSTHKPVENWVTITQRVYWRRYTQKEVDAHSQKTDRWGERHPGTHRWVSRTLHEDTHIHNRFSVAHKRLTWTRTHRRSTHNLTERWVSRTLQGHKKIHTRFVVCYRCSIPNNAHAEWRTERRMDVPMYI